VRGGSIQLQALFIAIKGAGELASAVAWRLYMANIRRIVMLETAMPLAVRREVAFCDAIHAASKTVEGVEAVKAQGTEQWRGAWDRGQIAVAVDPQWKTLRQVRPDVLVDAILAKRNLGTRLSDAVLVIGLGPGFVAGKDVHVVIETQRGHHLGRILTQGSAEPDTGIPGPVDGIAADRVLRSPDEGEFLSDCRIGDRIAKGMVVGRVRDTEVLGRIDGVLRGLIRPGTEVARGLKIGDIDPRANAAACFTISDKARAVAGSVLEAVLRTYNR
jgi:xanthine dehydrogenase accessory factor